MLREPENPPPLRVIAWGDAVRPIAGATSCGDICVARDFQDWQLFAVADALGHGTDAAKSAQRLAAALVAHPSSNVRELFLACEQALRGHRGAVLSIVKVTSAGVAYAGVGNVDLYGPPGVARPANVAGMLGRPPLRVRELAVEVAAGQRWVLASDGMMMRQLPAALEATRALEPRAAAPRLIELAARQEDDASVLVMDFGAR